MQISISKPWLSFIAAFAISVIFFFPFITNDFIYEDDYQRLFYGYSGWSANGRPIADLIYYILSPGSTIIDIHPMGQVANFFVCGIIAFLFCKRYECGAVLSSCIAVAIFCNPFYLENITYRFDSLTMAISVLCACLPFLIRVKSTPLRYLVFSASIFVSLSIYQVSLNIYLCFFAVYLLMTGMGASFKEIISKVAENAIQCVVALIAYQSLSKLFVGGKYSKNLSKPITDADGSILHTLITSIRRVTNLTLSPMDSAGFYIYASLMLLALAIAILLTLKGALRAPTRGLTLLIAAGISAFVFCGGAMLSLAHPVVFPRTAMGVGGVLAVVCTVIYLAFGESRHKSVILGASLSLLVFHFSLISYSYANSLNRQYEMQEVITSSIIQSLSSSKASELYVSGLENTRNSDLLNFYHNRLSGSYPILSWLTPTIYGRWGWIIGTKLKMYGIDSFKGEFDRKLLSNNLEGKCSDGVFYTECLDGKKLYIKF